MTTITATLLILGSKAAFAAPKLAPWVRIVIRLLSQMEVF